MSFIVFSTEGRILMSLTEDRWVRIRFRVALNPFLSHHQAAENECNTRFGCRSHTVRIPLKYSVQEEIPDGYFPFIAIWLWCCWSGQLLNCIVCVILRAGRVTVSLLPSSFWTSASSPLSLSAWQFLRLVQTNTVSIHSSVTRCWYSLERMTLLELLSCYHA